MGGGTISAGGTISSVFTPIDRTSVIGVSGRPIVAVSEM